MSFQNRQNNVFPCHQCGRMTTGAEDLVDADICEQCYELAGWDNQFNDDGRAPTSVELAACNAILQVIEDRGGDVTVVRNDNPYIWQGA